MDVATVVTEVAVGVEVGEVVEVVVGVVLEGVAEVILVEVELVAYSSHISGMLPTGSLLGPDLHPLQEVLLGHKDWRRQALGEEE